MAMTVAELVAKLRLDASGFTSGLKGATKKLDEVGRSMMQTGSVLTRRLSLPLAGVGIASVKLATDFDSSMSKITGLVGIAADEVAEMGEATRALAGETARSPRELADALFFVTSAGLRGESAMSVLEMSAKAAAAGLGETATIADAVTSAMNAYGEEVLPASRATDILAAAVREGKLEAASLAPVLGRLLPTASAMGIGFEQVAGVLAVMSKTGLDAAEASTSLQAIMSTMLKPSKEAQKTLESVGLSMGDLRKVAAGPGGMIEVMRLLADRLDGNDEALAQVIPNVRAFRGAMNVLAQDASIVDSVMQGVADSTGATDAAFQVASETAGFKFAQALTDLKNAAIDIGNILIPALVTVAAAVGSVAEGFQNLDPALQTFIVALGAVAAAAGPVLVAAGAVAIAIAALGGPVVAASVAIGLLIAAGITLAAHWDRVSAGLAKTWNSIRTTAVNVFNSIAKFFGRWWPVLLAPFTGGLSLLVKLFVDHWDAIVEFVQSIPGVMVDIGKAIMGGLKDGIVAAAKGVFNAVKDAVLAPVNWAKDFLGISSPSKLFHSFGVAVGEGFALGIGSTSRVVLQAAGELSRAAVDAFDDAALSVDEFTRATGDLRAEMAAAESNELRNQIATVNGGFLPAYDAAVAKVAEFEDAIAGAVTELGRESDELARLEDNLKAAEAAHDNAKAKVVGLEDALRAAHQSLADFVNAPLAGTQAFSDELFGLEQAAAAIQLNITEGQLAGMTDEELEPFRAELERIRLEAQRVRLREQLELDPLRRQLERAGGAAEELTFDEARSGAQRAARQITQLKVALDQARGASEQTRTEVGLAQAAFDAQKVVVEKLETAVGEMRGAVTELKDGISASVDLIATRFADMQAAIEEATAAAGGGGGAMGGLGADMDDLGLAAIGVAADVALSVEQIAAEVAAGIPLILGQMEGPLTAAQVRAQATIRSITDPIMDVIRAIGGTSVPSGPGFGGSFADGGVVPGRRGQSVMIEAHGGETVLPTHKPGFGGGGGDVFNFSFNGPVAGEQELVRLVQRAVREEKRISGRDRFSSR